VTGEQVAALVLQHGLEEVGRRYLRTDPNDSGSWWVREAVWFGTGIDEETHLQLILAALDACENDGEYWRIGDQPVEEGLVARPGMKARLRELRATDDRIARLWTVMLRYYEGLGIDAGWWRE
jgi:hypothetical protein